MKKNPNYVFKLNLMFLFIALAVSACTPKEVSGKKKKNDVSLAKVLVKKEFIIGVRDDLPPFSFLNLFTTKLEGYDIEVAEELCKNMKIKPIFKAIAWNERDKLLNNGEIDCIWSGFSYSKERDEAYSLTTPYIKSAVILVVKDKDPYYSIQDIREKKIGVIALSSIHANLKKAELTYGVFKNTVVFQKAQDALNALEKDEINCIVYDLLSINSLMQAKTGSYRVLDEAIAYEEYVIAFRKEDIALMNAVESTLKDMAKTDFLEKTSKKWFGANVSIIGR
ncbi:substrate-binding periplasmic protein [Treponema putidum]|uniref:Amino acid ABC transporter substrate-binding protein n=1 Tax=Treponema putidum TaxID=221027 RepID=A0AAE9MQ71_9SPIR|nr:transporter substrate-binding domain-containing protein [Treponema putidum]AIN93996.1 ABC transporter substrate-binding protein [Treponema putidum]TWI76952.1 polar amino acid transport system substrate-binding protein [Treponema putidum]UTY27931.1 amino acid ABC transporter substrate-binding protein [Treponema putidum]UTY30376.1 amino acid ABC transporter substrate-binding protein [Treponema putidum]UTY32845.1 amino acid ABC transporter substrate-binding protein [Treponema putidum]